MGVDTKAILNGAKNIDEVVDYMESKYNSVNIHTTHSNGFIQISFIVDGTKRLLSVFDSSYSEDYGLSSGVLVSLGSDPIGIDVIDDVASTFGGWLCRNDCNGEWEERSGLFHEGSGIPYFYRWGVINGFIDSRSSVTQLMEAAKAWQHKIGSPHSLEFEVGN